jgi:hypothetical protein
MEVSTEQEIINTDQDWRLGKAPARGHIKMLNFADYVKADVPVPEKTNFWKKRAAFPLRSYGNNSFGCCTKASQAILATKMERIEFRRTINITDDEIIRNYLAMTSRLYGGGDTGAYELDALNEWRNPDRTFRDDKGHPLTIDAYTRINQNNSDDIKRAIFLSGAHGIKVCFNLPVAWSRTTTWDVPDGVIPMGPWQPGSWGGHSMTSASDYDKDWIYLDHTWGVPAGRISWKAFAIYCDEAYSVIDSVASWKKRLDKKQINIPAIIGDVNAVSDVKIK